MIDDVRHRPAPRRALDPELAALQVLIPEVDIADIPRARAVEQDVTREMRRGVERPDLDIADTGCPRPDGSQIPVRIYRPTRVARRALPVLVFFHGGSFVTGGLDTEDTRCEAYATQAECLVVSVDYRLAPEHPFPAGFEDCRDVLAWVVAHAVELGVDPGRIAVGGLSAGGALAAGVAAHARDLTTTRIALQLLLFPVLDAAMTTTSVRTFADTPILTSGGVASMWELYLNPADRDQPPGYASPAHLDDLHGLPPVFLSTAEFDPLRDEAILFAQRLLAAGVPVELRHYARAFHSFDSFRATRIATGARRDQVEALRIAFT